MTKLLKNLKIVLLTFFIISFLSGCYLLITKNLIVFADSGKTSFQDEQILRYYHEPSIEEDFEDNKVDIILKSSYDKLDKISFNEFKIVEQVSEINSIKYKLHQYKRGDGNIIYLEEEENHMFTLELAVKDKQTVLNAISQLYKLDMVLVAEPSYIYEVKNLWTPSDTFYEEQWGLNGAYGINAEQAWDITTGDTSVKVGIMEAGIDWGHGDLQGSNGNLTPASGTDLSHGTHVAGIIGAPKANYGVSGIADVSMYLLDIVNFVDSLEYANKNNIKVINASFGFADETSYIPYNPKHYNALKMYNGLFVAAAGNESNNNDVYPLYPASYDLPNVISVGAIDKNGEESYFSNFGATTVDVFAPGYNILSTYPENLCTGIYRNTSDGDFLECECVRVYENGKWIWKPNGTKHYDYGYHYASGTSIAAPHVTGVAALLLSIDNTFTGAELKQLICDNVDKDSRLSGLCVTGGRLNAYNAVGSIKYKLKLVETDTWTVEQELCIKDEISISTVPTRPDYEFEGYYTGKNGTGTKYIGTKLVYSNGYYYTRLDNLGKHWYSTSDLTLYANWTQMKTSYTYNVYQQDGGGKPFTTGTMDIKSGEKIKLTAPTIEGYTFYRWVINDVIYYAEEEVEVTLTLYRSPVTGQITIYYKRGGAPSDNDGYMQAVYTKDSKDDKDDGKCIAEGTLITLADGSQKAVELLTGNEQLLVWNLKTGSFDSAPILFIDSDALSYYEIINLYFSDGTSVKVISEHAFWDFDLNKYVYLRNDAEKYIGHWFNKQITNVDGTIDRTKVQLTDVVIDVEYTTTWSPVTYGHLCYYVNGMLSMPGGIEGLFNIFEVDAETLTYDEAAYEADIATYGLFTYEEFYELYNIPEVMFDACGGQYLKIAIGKGLIDYSTLSQLVERYGTFFEN